MIGFILSIFFIYLLYHYFLSNNNSSSNNNNNQSQQQQGDQRKKKILSSNAQILQNILNFPENKERITISLENVLIKRINKESSFEYNILEMNYLHIFLELAQVYLLLHANTDEEQNAMTDEILKQLSNLSPEINFPRHRILFYSSEIGKKAIIRQIQPHVHIDDDSLICEQLAQFIMFMIQVDPLNCDNDRPILSYPKVIQSGRVYPWYLIPSISRLCEIRPLVEEQIKKK